jgi:maltose-binding protein MalE
MKAEIGLNKTSLKEAVNVLKEWLKQEPHLPSEVGKLIIYKLL